MTLLHREPGPLTLGLAGHIDHGKSALLAALSGARTDRLPEEQARGMTIALGYAQLSLPCGRTVSVIDVPGHERLVRVMVSGATGIDVFLVVIAADDGVMPQTLEHVEVLRALDVRVGVVAVTKSDLADPGPALDAARALLPASAAVVCSSRTGEGVAEVAEALRRATASVTSRARRAGGCVLHIDRVFSIRGAGTVVTGTLWSGTVNQGERLQLLPAGRVARVRAVQVHDRPLRQALAGQRVAVNLTGVSRHAVRRGDVLAALDTELEATYRFDARLQLVRPQPRRGRVQVHHGTRETPGRLVHLEGDSWQVRVERPLLAGAGDRVVIRTISVPDTLGGGVITDARPSRHSGPRTARAGSLPGEGQPPAGPSGPSRQPSQRASPGPASETSRVPSEAAVALEQRLRAAGVRPLSEAQLGSDAQQLAALRAAGRAVRVGRAMYAHPEAIAHVSEVVRELVAAEGHVTLGRLRDELGISRRYAQALLEHLDSSRVTLRMPDDRRVLRRSAVGRRLAGTDGR